MNQSQAKEQEGQVQRLADACEILASPTRWRILLLLLRVAELRPDDPGLSVGEIVEALGIAQSTVSRHLGLLRRAGWLAFAREWPMYHCFFLRREREAAVRLLPSLLGEQGEALPLLEVRPAGRRARRTAPRAGGEAGSGEGEAPARASFA